VNGQWLGARFLKSHILINWKESKVPTNLPKRKLINAQDKADAWDLWTMLGVVIIMNIVAIAALVFYGETIPPGVIP
jgi:hypothetical protein